MLNYLNFEFNTREPKDLDCSNKIILWSSSYDTGVNALKELNLFDNIVDAVQKDKKPILGICLGMQLLGTKVKRKTFGIEFDTGELIKLKIQDLSS